MAKKAFWAALAIASVLVSSVACTKGSDDPDVQGTITVNNSILYEQLGIREEVMDALAEGAYAITDSVLIYDNTGALVSKFGAEVNSLMPLILSVPKLSKGTFTIIAWQTARSKNGKPSWKLSGENMLSTVSLNVPTTPIPFEMAVGYASATISGDSPINGSVGFKPIGSIVEYNVEGLTADTGYRTSFIWENDDDYTIGMRLNPNLDDASRWVTSTDEEDYNTICGINVGETNRKWFTLTHGENLNIIFSAFTGEKVESQYGYTVPKINAGDHLVFYLDFDSLIWQPPFCGTQEEFTSWKADRKAGKLVDDPLLKWGCDLAEVQKHIEAKQWWQQGNEKMEYWEEDFACWHKWYYVAAKLTEQYLFETEDGKNLRYVMSYIWDSGQSLDLLNNSLLKKGYIYKGKTVLPLDGETYDLFVSPDGKTDALTIAGDEEDVLNVLYLPHA